MSVSRRGDWMQTFSGVQFWPLDAHPDEVVLEDIAHALAHIVRYGGHVERPYTVAQHSVLVSARAERLAREKLLGGHHVLQDAGDLKHTMLSLEALCVLTSLRGLMHDATEAYLGDMIRPLKKCMPEYEKAEDALMVVICERFELGTFNPLEEQQLGENDRKSWELVKQADEDLLVTEATKFFPESKRPARWFLTGSPTEGLLMDVWDATMAKALFLARFHEVNAKRADLQVSLDLEKSS